MRLDASFKLVLYCIFLLLEFAFELCFGLKHAHLLDLILLSAHFGLSRLGCLGLCVELNDPPHLIILLLH